MINEILRKHKLINEAAAIKKDSFKYFFVDEIKNIDTIADVEDLGDLKNVEILLTTDKNYVAGVKPSKGDWYKIDTEDLIKFMEKTVDKFEAGDYLDFISSYSLEDLIKNYLEHTYKFKCFNKWADFVGAMEGAGKLKGLQENRYMGMSPKEAAKYAYGANAFPKEFIDTWEVKSGSSRDDSKANDEIRKLKQDGFEVVRKRYSDFIGWCGVRRKTGSV